jgi:nucleoside-diphosphate-sugar epimerase
MALGAEPFFVDVLDAASVDQAMAAAQPEVVIEQLTALPKHYTPAALRDALDATNRVRIVGGGNLQLAAERHGVRRYLAQSGAYFYAPGPTLAEESDAFISDGSPVVRGNVQSLTAIEERVLSSRILEGITLRYGFFSGPGTWWAPDGDVARQVRALEFPITGEGEGIWPFIHIDDAVDATILAITNGEPGPYNIVDDENLSLATWLSVYASWVGAPPPPRVPVGPETDPDTLYYATCLRGASNAKAKRLLGFRPRPREWVSAHPPVMNRSEFAAVAP